MKNRYIDDQETFLKSVVLSGSRAARELDGAVELGLRAEALRRARQFLRRRTLTAEIFAAAFDAVMIHATSSKRWRRLIECAYARLSRLDQRACRSRMLSFYWAKGDYAAAAKFIPARSQGAGDPVDLAFSLQTLAELGRLEEARRLARRCERAARDAENPVHQAHLLAGLAVYHSKTGDWEKAAEFWRQTLRADDSYAENALLGLVEIRIRQALQAAHDGLATLENLKRQHNPVLETMLPGNQKKRWEEFRPRLTGLGTLFERALAKLKRVGS